MEKNKNDWYANDEQAEAYAKAGITDKQTEEAMSSVVESDMNSNDRNEDSREHFSEDLYFFEQGTGQTEFAEEFTPEDLKEENEFENSPAFVEEITSVAAEEEDIDPGFVKEITSEDMIHRDQEEVPEELKQLAEAATEDNERDGNAAEEFSSAELTNEASETELDFFDQPGTDFNMESTMSGLGGAIENDEHREEFAADLAPQFRDAGTMENEEEGRHVLKHTLGEETVAENRGFGIFSLIAAIVSLFVWPAILGPAAVVLGFIAWGRGNRGLGISAIAIGLISFLTYAIFMPMLY